MLLVRSNITRVFVSYTLILSMLCAVLLPVYASVDDASSRVLLCTSQGYQWVSLAGDSLTPEQADDNRQCIYCLLGGDLPAFLATGSSLAVAQQCDVQQSTGDEVVHKLFRLSSAYPRAPPVIL